MSNTNQPTVPLMGGDEGAEFPVTPISVFAEQRAKGKNPVQIAVGKIAAASKSVKVAPGALESARQELLAAKVDRSIEEALNPEPPYTRLSDDYRRQLAERLNP